MSPRDCNFLVSAFKQALNQALQNKHIRDLNQPSRSYTQCEGINCQHDYYSYIAPDYLGVMLISALLYTALVNELTENSFIFYSSFFLFMFGAYQTLKDMPDFNSAMHDEHRPSIYHLANHTHELSSGWWAPIETLFHPVYDVTVGSNGDLICGSKALDLHELAGPVYHYELDRMKNVDPIFTTNPHQCTYHDYDEVVRNESRWQPSR